MRGRGGGEYARQVYSLDVALLMAGTKWRGEFEERLKAVMDEVISTQDVIIFVDEVRFCKLTDRSSGRRESSIKGTYTSLRYQPPPERGRAGSD
jgi:SpoVK/Ycf46/Vps4 family AAA+-type ATPase